MPELLFDLRAGALNSSHVGRVEKQKLRIESGRFEFVGSFLAALFVARAD